MENGKNTKWKMNPIDTALMLLFGFGSTLPKIPFLSLINKHVVHIFLDGIKKFGFCNIILTKTLAVGLVFLLITQLDLLYQWKTS